MTKIIDSGLGTKSSQPTFVKLPKITVPKKKDYGTISYRELPIVESAKKEQVIIELPKIVESIKEHFGTIVHNEIPVTKQETPKDKNDASIIDVISTGFGDENTLYADCPKITYHQHLCKELFLSEFKTEEEKSQVRLNLGIPSIQEVHDFVTLKLADYVTKDNLTDTIAGTVKLQNYYTKIEVDNKLSSLKLKLDTVPTKGSMNGVTSDGVWQHVDDTVGEIHRYVKTI